MAHFILGIPTFCEHVNGYFIARPLFHGKIEGRRGQDGLLQLTGSSGCAVNKSIVGLLKSHEPLTPQVVGHHLLQAMNCSRQPAFLVVRRSPFWPLLWIRCMLRTPQMSKRKSLKRHFVRCSVAFQLFSVRGVTAKARFSRYFILHLPAILQSRWLHFSAARFQLNAVGELNASWASLCLQRVINCVGMMLFFISTILIDESMFDNFFNAAGWSWF